MIDYLKNKFVDEARDLVEELESSLLLLEDDPDNDEVINRIFRALHSLKGAGSMFGFELVSEFTHGLETVYEEIRAKRLRINREILDLTLQSVDVLRRLLSTDIEIGNELREKVGSIKFQILEQAGISEQNLRSLHEAKTFEDEVNEAERRERRFKIIFQPGESILKTGNNPFYMLDELYNLGDVKIEWIRSGIPDLEVMDVHLCYSSWIIEITTKEHKEQIREVFLFIEEESVIEIEEMVEEKEQEIASIIEKPFKEEKQASAKSVENASATIRVSSVKLDQLMNLVSELVTLQARLDLIAVNNTDQEITNLAESLHKLSRQLRDITFDICMIPLQSIVTRFQRLVRDLSSETGKNVRFITEGGETELDKTIVENITDPLLHIIRNSLDHGIEDAATRESKGKPAQGTVRLRAFYQGPSVCIEISDDGAGINTQKVLNKAIEKGLISDQKSMAENEIYDLMFLPGFSTAEKVSSISGRGVGLDVVRQKIGSLRGEIRVQSKPGEGSTFTFKLPLTLSIIDGLLVEAGTDRFILPLEFVNKILVCDHEEILNAYKGLIPFDGMKIPFYYLRDEFNIQAELPPHEEIVIINYMGTQVGLAVDRVIGEHQVVIKPLGKVFNEIQMFSGAAILGDGGLALVLDLHRMISDFSGTPVINTF